MRFRVEVEVKWLLFLASYPSINEITEIRGNSLKKLQALYQNFDLNDAERVQQIEAQTNHDVKAIEYFIKEKLQDCEELRSHLEFIHFACTSEDINNLAYALMVKESREKILIPSMQDLISELTSMAKSYAGQPLLSRTHGQPASPTTVGKEFANVCSRLQRQLSQVEATQILGNCLLYTSPSPRD